MFSVPRSRALDDVVWSVTPDEAEYIEAWKFSSCSPLLTEHARYGRLHESEIEDWLLQKGQHCPPQPPSPDARLEGGIRLIISERRFFRPPSLSISRESYLRIEDEFHLSHVSLPALMNEHGLCSRFEEYDDTDPSKLLRIKVVIKAPQKYQVGNYCLTVSYDFKTGFTTGLLVGTGVIQGGDDFPSWRKCPAAEMLDLIKAVPSLLAHPMILPTILLQHHLYRTEQICDFHLGGIYSAIQRQLGMSRAGRLHRTGRYNDPIGDKTIEEARVNLRVLTGEMNTHLAEFTWYCKVSDWHGEFIQFLTQMLTNVGGTPDASNRGNRLSGHHEIKESIEYLDSVVRGLARYNYGTKERAEGDFGVLYSIIGQLDNRLNAKISASSSRDSTAMKALAFITTFFLPGTFVATVFSMSMFNWQPSTSDDSSRIVSSYFWVYWAVTVPLTCIVAFSWRLWWNQEKLNFDRDVRTEIDKLEELKSWDSGKRPLGAQAADAPNAYISTKGWGFRPWAEANSIKRRNGGLY